MTEISLSQALSRSVAEILEQMFFVDASEAGAGGGPEPSGEDGITARLTFEGDPPGWLWVRLPHQAARLIAADFLGEEPSDLCARKIDEVICELANMICGSVLNRLESHTAFRLAAPAIVPAVEAQGAGPPATAGWSVPLAGGTLAVRMAMEGPACPATEKYAF